MDRPEHERALHELMYGYAHKKIRICSNLTLK